MPENEMYDVVVIGSGMGGLACASLLSKEGKKVIVLEKNRQFGGNLQVFSREKCIFETGVHYIGGLEDGEVLNRLFRYYGIMQDLKLKKMDKNGFDRIHFFNEDKTYRYGMGYENFIKTLIRDFPDQKQAILAYCDAIHLVVDNLPLLRLNPGEANTLPDIDLTQNAREYIHSITDNKTLQNVLSANNCLYGGSENTPFYLHALVQHFYIISSFRCVDGAGQIARFMVKRIRESGGTVLNRAEVVSAKFSLNSRMESVTLENGRTIYGKTFISNLHPRLTIDLLGRDHFKRRYVDKIEGLKNTPGLFVVNVVFRKKSLEYKNYNIFQINARDVWKLNTPEQPWPSFYMISMSPGSRNPKYAAGASIICAVDMDEWKPWERSFNTTLKRNYRGEDYEAFKKAKAEKVLDALSVNYPEIRNCIKSYTTSTPLTQRDYTGSPDGSAYGIEKDCSPDFRTFLSPRTGISNLFLTGQSLVHGILGVNLAALLTCSQIVPNKEMLKKISMVK